MTSRLVLDLLFVLLVLICLLLNVEGKKGGSKHNHGQHESKPTHSKVAVKKPPIKESGGVNFTSIEVKNNTDVTRQRIFHIHPRGHSRDYGRPRDGRVMHREDDRDFYENEDDEKHSPRRPYGAHHFRPERPQYHPGSKRVFTEDIGKELEVFDPQRSSFGEVKGETGDLDREDKVKYYNKEEDFQDAEGTEDNGEEYKSMPEYAKEGIDHDYDLGNVRKQEDDEVKEYWKFQNNEMDKEKSFMQDQSAPSRKLKEVSRDHSNDYDERGDTKIDEDKFLMQDHLSPSRKLKEPPRDHSRERGDDERRGNERDGEREDGERRDGEREDGERVDGERGDGERGDGERGDGERGDDERGDGERGDGERLEDDGKGDNERGHDERGDKHEVLHRLYTNDETPDKLNFFNEERKHFGHGLGDEELDDERYFTTSHRHEKEPNYEDQGLKVESNFNIHEIEKNPSFSHMYGNTDQKNIDQKIESNFQIHPHSDEKPSRMVTVNLGDNGIIKTKAFQDENGELTIKIPMHMLPESSRPPVQPPSINDKWVQFKNTKMVPVKDVRTDSQVKQTVNKNFDEEALFRAFKAALASQNLGGTSTTKQQPTSGAIRQYSSRNTWSKTPQNVEVVPMKNTQTYGTLKPTTRQDASPVVQSNMPLGIQSRSAPVSYMPVPPPQVTQPPSLPASAPPHIIQRPYQGIQRPPQVIQTPVQFKGQVQYQTQAPVISQPQTQTQTQQNKVVGRIFSNSPKVSPVQRKPLAVLAPLPLATLSTTETTQRIQTQQRVSPLLSKLREEAGVGKASLISSFTQWNPWSPCSSSCGTGISVRARLCLQKNTCDGIRSQTKSCLREKCKETLGHEALIAHNKFRKWHHADPLKWSEELSKGAQAIADALAERKVLALGDLKELPGEGISQIWHHYSTAGEKATESWYEEVKNYNFATPTLSDKTRHFTQMVWKSSKELGVGVAKSLGGEYTFVVALYKPAGNDESVLEENVEMPGQDSSIDVY